MKSIGLKCDKLKGSGTEAFASTERAPASMERDQLPHAHPEFIAALGVIVSAFVDLGFGSSAAHLALRAANDNRGLAALAAEYQRTRK